MRVYLDNCCYNRPFDEQALLSVRLETLAKLAVQFMMASGKIEFVWSKILDFEISYNPFPKRRTTISAWKRRATVFVATDEGILTRAEDFESVGIRPKDAIHIASAEAGGCDWFLTTDRGILKKLPAVGAMRVANPVDFVMETMHGTN